MMVNCGIIKIALNQVAETFIRKSENILSIIKGIVYDEN